MQALLKRHRVFMAVVALIVCAAFLTQSVAFAAEKPLASPTTLAAPSVLTEQEFRQKFALGQFLLSHDAINTFIKDHVTLERRILGDEVWGEIRNFTIDPDDARYRGNIDETVPGLEQIQVVKVSGLLYKTGQFAHVGLRGKDYGGRPVIYIDSLFFSEDGASAILRHETDEMKQWEAFRIACLEPEEVTREEMRRWIQSHIDVPDPALAGTPYAGLNARELAKLFHDRSYPIGDTYRAVVDTVVFDFEHIKLMASLYDLDETSGDANIAAHASGRDKTAMSRRDFLAAAGAAVTAAGLAGCLKEPEGSAYDQIISQIESSEELYVTDLPNLYEYRGTIDEALLPERFVERSQRQAPDLPLDRPTYVYKRDSVYIVIFDGYPDGSSQRFMANELRTLVNTFDALPAEMVSDVHYINVVPYNTTDVPRGTGAMASLGLSSITFVAFPDPVDPSVTHKRLMDVVPPGHKELWMQRESVPARWLTECTTHEIGHHVAYSIGDFDASSDWTPEWEAWVTLHEEGADNVMSYTDLDHTLSDWSQPYGRTNPSEDFACIFSAISCWTDELWDRAVLVATGDDPTPMVLLKAFYMCNLYIRKWGFLPNYWMEEMPDRSTVLAGAPADVAVEGDILWMGHNGFRFDGEYNVTGIIDAEGAECAWPDGFRRANVREIVEFVEGRGTTETISMKRILRVVTGRARGAIRGLAALIAPAGLLYALLHAPQAGAAAPEVLGAATGSSSAGFFAAMPWGWIAVGAIAGVTLAYLAYRHFSSKEVARAVTDGDMSRRTFLRTTGAAVAAGFMSDLSAASLSLDDEMARREALVNALRDDLMRAAQTGDSDGYLRIIREIAYHTRGFLRDGACDTAMTGIQAIVDTHGEIALGWPEPQREDALNEIRWQVDMIWWLIRGTPAETPQAIMPEAALAFLKSLIITAPSLLNSGMARYLAVTSVDHDAVRGVHAAELDEAVGLAAASPHENVRDAFSYELVDYLMTHKYRPGLDGTVVMRHRLDFASRLIKEKLDTVMSRHWDRDQRPIADYFSVGDTILYLGDMCGETFLAEAVACLEEAMMRPKDLPYTMGAVATLRMLHDKRPESLKPGSLAAFLCSLSRDDESLLYHPWPHYRVYADRYFSDVAAQRGLGRAAKYSVALSAYRLLKRLDLEENAASIRKAVDLVLGARDDIGPRELFMHGGRVINILHKEFERNQAAMEAFEKAAEAREIATYVGAAKDDALAAIANITQPTTIWVNAHGNREGFSLSDGPTKPYIRYAELGDALLASGEDLSRVVLIVSACYGYSFCANLMDYLDSKGAPSLPIVISTVNYDRFEQGDAVRTILRHPPTSAPFTFNDFFELEEEVFAYGDPAIFIPESGRIGAAQGDRSGQPLANDKVKPLTRRMLEVGGAAFVMANLFFSDAHAAGAAWAPHAAMSWGWMVAGIVATALVVTAALRYKHALRVGGWKALSFFARHPGSLCCAGIVTILGAVGVNAFCLLLENVEPVSGMSVSGTSMSGTSVSGLRPSGEKPSSSLQPLAAQHRLIPLADGIDGKDGISMRAILAKITDGWFAEPVPHKMAGRVDTPAIDDSMSTGTGGSVGDAVAASESVQERFSGILRMITEDKKCEDEDYFWNRSSRGDDAREVLDWVNAVGGSEYEIFVSMYGTDVTNVDMNEAVGVFGFTVPRYIELLQRAAQILDTVRSDPETTGAFISLFGEEVDGRMLVEMAQSAAFAEGRDGINLLNENRPAPDDEGATKPSSLTLYSPVLDGDVTLRSDGAATISRPIDPTEGEMMGVPMTLHEKAPAPARHAGRFINALLPAFLEEGRVYDIRYDAALFRDYARAQELPAGSSPEELLRSYVMMLQMRAGNRASVNLIPSSGGPLISVYCYADRAKTRVVNIGEIGIADDASPEAYFPHITDLATAAIAGSNIRSGVQANYAAMNKHEQKLARFIQGICRRITGADIPLDGLFDFIKSLPPLKPLAIDDIAAHYRDAILSLKRAA